MRYITLMAMAIILLATGVVAYGETQPWGGDLSGTVVEAPCEDSAGNTMSVPIEIPGPCGPAGSRGPRGYRGPAGTPGITAAEIESLVDAKLRELGLDGRFTLVKGYAEQLVAREAQLRAEADRKAAEALANEAGARANGDNQLSGRIEDWKAQKFCVSIVLIALVVLALLCFMKKMGGK